MEKPRPDRKTHKRQWIVVFALLFVALGALVLFFATPLRTLLTLKKVDAHPLYTMRYYGDYGFASFLKVGLRPLKKTPTAYRLPAEKAWACTCFAAMNEEGHVVFGRNFDWYLHPALLLFTDPSHGYASVSMVDISYLGFDREGIPLLGRASLLPATHMPFDGMNERGLAVGIMAVSHAEGGEDPAKVTLSGLHGVRLLLDYAQDVEEAIALLEQYNIDFGGGPPLHYLIADASGHSAVVEWIDGELAVFRNQESWQVATNFLIAEEQPQEARSSCRRYNTAYESLARAEGKASPEEAMSLLQRVASTGGTCPTIWSTVYDLTAKRVLVVMDRNAERVRTFDLTSQ